MFNPTRDQARQFLFDAWEKMEQKAVLTDLEKMTIAIMWQHPEYHTLLAAREKFLDRDYPPEFGDTNPFLHLSMHLAIEEQLSIDQPQGIKSLYLQMTQQCGSEHDAQHQLMDCLGEMIWHAQRYHTAPNPSIYLGCLRGKLGLLDPPQT
ncbi:DUF1841 family protein [Parachitinimonas caeni]|uniref:DUF1841 family protein n=1 Tax=Parachitinimonas caeni TaxID=3031301 RepID=A0ABT7E1J6_9NEIS|nr:DUF1841 family protein [Parachitinimonas caeni]MDK2124782.1 DUF1841 family protein [Parachitinimonas caeni]